VAYIGYDEIILYEFENKLPGKGCGPLESTILHELVHHCRGKEEKVPEACEASCFKYNPYKRANPCDCK
jgi:hypothetical protein